MLRRSLLVLLFALLSMGCGAQSLNGVPNQSYDSNHMNGVPGQSIGTMTINGIGNQSSAALLPNIQLQPSADWTTQGGSCCGG